jgi:hypothetical protein
MGQLAARMAGNGAETLPEAFLAGTPSMRRRVEVTAETLYTDIEDALRETLRSASKERHVRCPECGKGFRLRVPDHQASVSAAKALLEIVVGRARPVDPPPEVEPPADVSDLKKMPTAELRRLVQQNRERAAREQSERDED